MGTVVMNLWLDYMVLEVFSSLNNSMYMYIILSILAFRSNQRAVMKLMDHGALSWKFRMSCSVCSTVVILI